MTTSHSLTPFSSPRPPLVVPAVSGLLTFNQSHRDWQTTSCGPHPTLACFWKLGLIETAMPACLLLCLWLFACYNGRAGDCWQRPCSRPRLNYLLSGPLKKKCDDSCKAAPAFQIPKAHCPLLTESFPPRLPGPCGSACSPRETSREEHLKRRVLICLGRTLDARLLLGSMSVFFP